MWHGRGGLWFRGNLTLLCRWLLSVTCLLWPLLGKDMYYWWLVGLGLPCVVAPGRIGALSLVRRVAAGYDAVAHGSHALASEGHKDFHK